MEVPFVTNEKDNQKFKFYKTEYTCRIEEGGPELCSLDIFYKVYDASTNTYLYTYCLSKSGQDAFDVIFQPFEINMYLSFVQNELDF